MSDLMPRPSIRDEYVRRRAAEIILPRVLNWMRWDGEVSPEEVHDTRIALMSIANENSDGHEMAKRLERMRGWTGDDSLVEILGEGWVRDAIEELTAQWVRCLNIRPQFKVGDTVIVSTAWRGGKSGTVVRIDAKLAQYGIRYPDMSEKSWTTFNFEDCAAPLAAITTESASAAQGAA